MGGSLWPICISERVLQWRYHDGDQVTCQLLGRSMGLCSKDLFKTCSDYYLLLSTGRQRCILLRYTHSVQGKHNPVEMCKFHLFATNIWQFQSCLTYTNWSLYNPFSLTNHKRQFLVCTWLPSVNYMSPASFWSSVLLTKNKSMSNW